MHNKLKKYLTKAKLNKKETNLYLPSLFSSHLVKPNKVIGTCWSPVALLVFSMKTCPEDVDLKERVVIRVPKIKAQNDPKIDSLY